jgi:hypothetical protein
MIGIRKPTAVLLLAGVLLFPPPAVSQEDPCPLPAERAGRFQWPAPVSDGTMDVAHFGEAHWNEGQGPLTMPVLVQDIVRADPDLLLFSSDIADIGTPDRLGCFRRIMTPIERAGIPWFGSPGNHDRVAIAGPGGIANGAIDIWRTAFGPMPAPWGDGESSDRKIVVPEREPSDGKGASTHYYFDYGPVRRPFLRVIVLDNSQHSLSTSDVDQYPAVGPGEVDAGQLAYLYRVATEAQQKGLQTWVVMHQPTQDPRDPSNVHPVSVSHTMGKGASPDNRVFDAIAQLTGIDVVLLGHIQGNALYTVGETEYFIDGGGGGSPYALHSVGTDTGYYYGYRLFRIDPKSGDHRTYFIPLIDNIEVDAPSRVEVGETLTLNAVARQPFDPDLPPRLGGVPNEPIMLELRPEESLDDAVPELAYMWRSSDPRMLKPIGDGAIDPTDDPAFDASSMTMSGTFKALKPGLVTVTIASGTHSETIRVRVVAP